MKFRLDIWDFMNLGVITFLTILIILLSSCASIPVLPDCAALLDQQTKEFEAVGWIQRASQSDGEIEGRGYARDLADGSLEALVIIFTNSPDAVLAFRDAGLSQLGDECTVAGRPATGWAGSKVIQKSADNK